MNDAFVMFLWAKSQGIEKLFMLPDGNADFTRRMGMLVDRSNNGMAMRSWRYSMYVNNGAIEKIFPEPEMQDRPNGVGVSVSRAETILGYLREAKAELAATDLDSIKCRTTASVG